MPNWMSTTLVVSGPEQDLADFKQKAEAVATDSNPALSSASTTPLSFESFVPMPKSLEISFDAEDDREMVVSTGMMVYHGEEIQSVLDRPEIKAAGVKDRDGLQLYFDVTSPKTRTLSGIYAKNLKDHGFFQWRDWRYHHWGTKWDVSDVDLSDDSATQLTYYFSTAWSPAEPVIAAMSRQHPTLHFEATFDEPGNDIYYFARWHKGEKTDENVLERNSSENSDDEEGRNDPEIDVAPTSLEAFDAN